VGKILYCENITLGEVINFGAFWSPLRPEIWGGALFTLGAFSTFQSFFNYKKQSKDSILNH